MPYPILPRPTWITLQAFLETRQELRQLAAARGIPMAQVLHDLVHTAYQQHYSPKKAKAVPRG